NESITIIDTSDSTNFVVVPVSITISDRPAAGLQVLPSSLQFTAQEGGFPQAAFMTVTNNGPAFSLLNYSISTDSDRIQVSGSTSALPPSASDFYSVTVDTSGLTAGTYHG